MVNSKYHYFTVLFSIYYKQSSLYSPKNKVKETFFIADEFCCFFNAMTTKYTVSTPKKRKYYLESTMSKTEAMLIIIP